MNTCGYSYSSNLNFSDMRESETICPYTGLRSFTEEESLYFKGREEHVLKVAAQLEEKKFTMVTGASGDGKSSLIFAGLIPQARAGFFKARYSNWYVADFRPERSPLKNVAKSLAGVLGHEDPASVEIELSLGFSSLVELYKSSDLYVDVTGEAWKQASEEGKGLMERKAGNLLILVDQFEEFFTNPENFPGGVPSQESRLLLNIILETIKISLKEDLPVYVVCTMRSDYIGQCAAFRGLPEFIGFSQFFVPRLQRKELHQVIKEPAILSGNRISNRLIDRLIFDLEEGTDQLPILQHALKQIWKAADNGRAEMDLIHYAKVGGMSGDKLPKETIQSFQIWRDKLPDYEKEYLKHPGLSNVLDIHANKLFEEAASYCHRQGYAEIKASQAKFIIAMSFACLTRIDESRPVRNRMTLEEITQIINVPEFTTEAVGLVLSIFREEDNTLLRPFITPAIDEQGQESNKTMTQTTVIDITHEALIRNWKLLKKWSDKEYEYYVTFLDFQQQVKRWIHHNKSEDFLLPIGPLTYFENWYKNCRPNQYWINRYNNSDSDAATKLQQSSAVLKNCRDFLRKSALRLLVTRTFMKYGAGRIGLAAGLVALLILSIFFFNQWRVQRNDYVLDQIIAEGETLLTDKEATPGTRAGFAVEADRLRPGFYRQALRALSGQQKIDIAINSFWPGNSEYYPAFFLEGLIQTDSLIRASGSQLDSASTLSFNTHLNNLNDQVRNQSYFLFSRQDTKVALQRTRNANDQAKLVRSILAADHRQKSWDMKALHTAITDVMNQSVLTKDQIQGLIDLISPLESRPQVRKKFQEWFPVGERITMGVNQNMLHNGGYQMLAYFYAASGNVNRTLQCLDSLKKSNQNYDKGFNNSTQIAGYFLQYGDRKAFLEFVTAYARDLDIPAYAYVKEILNRAAVPEIGSIVKFIKHGNFNDGLKFFGEQLVMELFDAAIAFSRRELKSPDALNFNLALLAKHHGVLEAKNAKRWGTRSQKRSDSLFQAALYHYGKVGNAYLEERIETDAQVFSFASEKRSMVRKYLFLYPDHFKTVESFILTSSIGFYGDDFFKFMVRNQLFRKFYKDQKDYELVTTWINKYFANSSDNGFRFFQNYQEPAHSTFVAVDSLITQSGYDADDAWIKMKLIQNYFERGDTLDAYRLAKSLKFKQFVKGDFAEETQPFYNNIMIVAGELAIRGKAAECLRIISHFSNTRNLITAYAKLTTLCLLNQRYTEAARYTDSTQAALNRVKTIQSDSRDFRLPVVEALTLQNNREGQKKALETIGSMRQFNRFLGVGTMVGAYAELNEQYKAHLAVPGLANREDRLSLYFNIIFRENLRRGNDSGEWKDYCRLVTDDLNFTWFQNDLAAN